MTGKSAPAPVKAAALALTVTAAETMMAAMVKGCFGRMFFMVNSAVVKTIDNAVWGGSARYSTHQRHLTDALTEFTGIDPDTFSFDLTLYYGFGVDIQEELGRLWKYEREGLPQSLVLGDKIYGKHKWVVKKHQIKMRSYDKHGSLALAVVSVDLMEYLRE